MKKNKKTLLYGEGIHQHTLYGKFKTDDVINDFADVEVKELCELKHEKPNGSFGEHKTLQVEIGDWKLGKQVEYNPFTANIERVFD